jgi:hypothetical protein
MIANASRQQKSDSPTSLLMSRVQVGGSGQTLRDRFGPHDWSRHVNATAIESQFLSRYSGCHVGEVLTAGESKGLWRG